MHTAAATDDATRGRERPDETLQDRLKAFVAKLDDEAQRRVDKRLTVEQRWIEDLRQYHGRYDDITQQRIDKNEGSAVFVNSTAVKTDALVARIWDLLFPTDDRNWGVEATPVPELTEQAEAALTQVDDAKTQGDALAEQAKALMAAGKREEAAAVEAQMRQAEDVENAAQAAADDLADTLTEAKRRANLMQEEIDDQLVACRFSAEARDAIEDAAKIGCGVLKGPVLGGVRNRWVKKPGEQDGPVQYVLERHQDSMPAAYRVDPWSFFPDPDRRRPGDMEGFLERHLLNKSQMRKLARDPEMDQDAIRELLQVGPDSGSTPNYLIELHDLTGQTDGSIKDSFQVWEWTGPVDFEDMEVLSEAFGGEEEREDLDPLEEFHVRIWFCQGRILSFAPHPLDSNDPIYSVFTIRPDETSCFGFGVPYIMRHPQSILNGAYRMMMDNSGLSTGPQIVVDKQQVEPEDGNWKLAPRKVWLKKHPAQTAADFPFQAFNIPSNQAELANIIAIANTTIDEVTAQPAIAQGEQGAGVTKTAQGMALLMNSANVVFRRIVKNYDDDMTVPIIRRFYDWNMQFNPKEAIKGDYDVKARGSSVLLVREMQAQNLLVIAQLFGDHPVYGPMIKHLNLLKQIFRAHAIAADEITRTDREYKQYLAELEEKPNPEAEAKMMAAQAAMEKLQLERDRLDAEISMSEMEWNNRWLIAKMTYDAKLEQIASVLNMSAAEIDAKVQAANATLDSKERITAVEAAMKEKTGDSAGGNI